jgi:hypothetical protein
MRAPRLSHKALAQQIMKANDPQGAIKTILTTLKDQTSMQIARAFVNCRKTILRDPEYLNKHGYGRLVSLSIESGLPETDKIKLKDLLLKPLHYIHWAQSVRVYLSCPEANERFKAIRIVQDPFYEFVCPDHITFKATQDRTQDKIAHNKHEKRERTSYHFSIQEVGNMVEHAHTYILQSGPCTLRKHYTQMLDALSLVSGRRKWELACTLKVKSVPNEKYQAMITGICKVFDFNEAWRAIPLLIPFDDFVGGLVKLRSYKRIEMGDYSGVKLFKTRKMTHTHFRNVYLDISFRERLSRNHFLIGDQSCGPSYWKSQALCTSVQDAAETYDVMCIDQDYEPINCHGNDEPSK